MATLAFDPKLYEVAEPAPLDPGTLRVMLDRDGLDPRGPWPYRFTVVAGHIVQPDDEPGRLRVDGERLYSAAWL
jgi:hypothetical protein